jgi:hypothetical protein
MARTFSRTIVAAALIALMAVGSIVLWLGIPVLVGIPASMVIVGKLLSKLNRAYGELTGTTPTVRVQLPWQKSMRGERGSGHPRTILDVVMVFSVSLALLCFAVWFFVFAGSSLPT